MRVVAVRGKGGGGPGPPGGGGGGGGESGGAIVPARGESIRILIRS